MKHPKSKIVFVLFALVLVRVLFDFYACTHDDVDLDEYIQKQSTNQTDLISLKVNTPPVLDGEIDAIWDDVPVLAVKAVVPDPGDNLFAGYVGNSYNVKLRSLYDTEYIYFLIEWDDPSPSYNRQPWYFNPTTKKWEQESFEHIINAAGHITRYAFYEDKVAFLWNINNSVADWNTKTCWVSCHRGLGSANGFARHYTNGPNEKLDMWHWKSVRDNPGTADDQYQDNTQPNGRKNDAFVTGTGALNNRQTLTVTGESYTVSVPQYFIPGKTYYYWISKTEIDNGTAKLITAVDANGVLTYDGGTLDPNGDANFAQEGATTGSMVIPSVTTSRLEGSRGDISAAPVYTYGKGWTLEMKRKLNTGDPDNDVNFSSLADHPFGIAIFNNARYSHALKPNLILKFKK